MMISVTVDGMKIFQMRDMSSECGGPFNAHVSRWTPFELSIHCFDYRREKHRTPDGSHLTEFMTLPVSMYDDIMKGIKPARSV